MNVTSVTTSVPRIQSVPTPLVHTNVRVKWDTITLKTNARKMSLPRKPLQRRIPKGLHYLVRMQYLCSAVSPSGIDTHFHKYATQRG